MKKRNWIIASILAGTLSLAGVAHACGGPRGHFRGDQVMHVIEKLDLTQEQRQAVRNIKNESRDQMDAKRDEMFEMRKALRKQSNAETYNTKKVRELANSKASIMADMIVQRLEIMSRIRNLLNEEQREKMNDIQERNFSRGGFSLR